jgi:hypothetical protein
MYDRKTIELAVTFYRRNCKVEQAVGIVEHEFILALERAVDADLAPVMTAMSPDLLIVAVEMAIHGCCQM